MSSRPLTRYEKELARLVAECFGGLSADRLVLRLCLLGIIHPTAAKVVVVRRFVDDCLRRGFRKMEAMELAADHFCASPDYIHKCIYYYRHMNF